MGVAFWFVFLLGRVFTQTTNRCFFLFLSFIFLAD